MKRYKILCTLMLTVAVFAACNNDDDGQDWGGIEHITFDVSGVVTDSDGSPLKNIAVATHYSDTVRTNGSGFYKVSGTASPVTALTVEYVDTDGEDNGGRFIKTSRKVDLVFKGGEHGPYLGKYEAEGIDVKMVANAVITPDVPEK